MARGSPSASQANGVRGEIRPSIVVIEDNPSDVFLVKQAIAVHHLDVDLQVFGDGEEALSMIARIDAEEDVACPNVMLLDINLPRTDGFTVLQRLRQSKNCAQIPVVVMTSSAAPNDRTKAAALGAKAYFQKPAGYTAFLKIGDIIENLLKRE